MFLARCSHGLASSERIRLRSTWQLILQQASSAVFSGYPSYIFVTTTKQQKREWEYSDLALAPENIGRSIKMVKFMSSLK